MAPQILIEQQPCKIGVEVRAYFLNDFQDCSDHFRRRVQQEVT